MKTSELTLWVKIRDAIDEYLETMNPNNPQPKPIEHEAISWTRDVGANGPYERYPSLQQLPNLKDKNYVALLKAVKEKQPYVHLGLQYAVLPDGTTIGRKPKQR